MASEIQHAIVRNNTAQPFNADSGLFEANISGHYANYAVSLTEEGVVGYYTGSIPTGLSAQLVDLDVRKQAGGSPAVSDAPLS